jgi:hypothetical protein
LEFIFESQVSCQKCECIFLKPFDDGYICPRFSTYEDNRIRYLNFDGERYNVKDFLNVFKDYLELRIIQLDHLTEEEQRDRGILQPDEKYIPKVRNVSRMSSKHAIKLESMKCQNLCAKCHLEETIDREIGITYNSRSHLEREKLEYVNQHKINNLGCAICKIWNSNLTRFFDLDHIDPSNKRESVSRMIKDSQFTLRDVIDECKKCRVLCRHCHIIHTSKQLVDKFKN